MTKAGLKDSERWCPTGCGKTLIYSIGYPEVVYPCDRCGKEFTKQQVKNFWNVDKRLRKEVK